MITDPGLLGSARRGGKVWKLPEQYAPTLALEEAALALRLGGIDRVRATPKAERAILRAAMQIEDATQRAMLAEEIAQRVARMFSSEG